VHSRHGNPSFFKRNIVFVRPVLQEHKKVTKIAYMPLEFLSGIFLPSYVCKFEIFYDHCTFQNTTS
jgi:hypothetical protein